jgi:hypothetical protein
VYLTTSRAKNIFHFHAGVLILVQCINLTGPSTPLLCNLSMSVYTWHLIRHTIFLSFNFVKSYVFHESAYPGLVLF